MAYTWKAGSHITVNANVAGQVCEELASKNNLTGKALVDASRPSDAPLHQHFEWDDSIAAEKYREEQGCHLIRCLTVKVEAQDATPVSVRAFFTTTESKQYEPIQVILAQDVKKAAMMKRAARELVSFKSKYSCLTELSGLFKEIDSFLEVIT